MNSAGNKMKLLPEVLRDIVYFLATGIFIRLWIRPELILQYHDPVFFTGFDFFSSMIRSPGGFCRYLAAFIVQCFIHPVWGSLIIAILLFLVSFFTKKCIQHTTGSKWVHSLHLLPAVLLLVLYTQYKYSTASTLGLLFACAFFFLYLRMPAVQTAWKLTVFLGLGLLLYWLAEGAFWLFALQCACHEWTRKDDAVSKRLILSSMFLGVAALLPWLALSFIVLGRYSETFLIMMPFKGITSYSVILLILYLFLPVAMIKFRIWENIKNASWSPALKGCTRLLEGKLGIVIETLTIMIVTAVSLWFSLNRDGRTIMLIDYYASGERWSDVLATVRTHPMNDSLTVFHTNRALFHTGLMGSDLFSFRQNLGTDGLWMSANFEIKARIQKSDLLFEMGHVNDALRWAHEAMSMRGETPQNLERIAEINLLKGQKEYASIAIEKLKKTPFHRARAVQLEKMLSENSVAGDRCLSRIQSWMPKTDFIISTSSPTFEFKKLLEDNPQNRMAFEYLMSYYLINQQVGDFIENLVRNQEFTARMLPRHYEETVIFYRMIADRKSGPDLSKYKLSKASMNRFVDYNQILARYKNNKAAAHSVLRQRHGNTYWYYLMYGKSPKPSS